MGHAFTPLNEFVIDSQFISREGKQELVNVVLPLHIFDSVNKFSILFSPQNSGISESNNLFFLKSDASDLEMFSSLLVSAQLEFSDFVFFPFQKQLHF